MRKYLTTVLATLFALSAFGCEMPNGNDVIVHNNESDHVYVERVIREPTCTQDGEKVFECICGVMQGEWLQPLEHDYEFFPEQEGTCMTPGISAYGVCKRAGCDYNSAIQLETNPNNHTFDENRVCIECGKVSATELKYELSNDKTYYIVTDGHDCRDTEIIIPSTYEGLEVKEIGDNAFEYMGSIREVIIPETVTKIGNKAFVSSSLEKAVIPSSVTEIVQENWGCSAFDANDIKEIIVAEDNPNYKSIDGNLYSKDGKILFQYARGKRESTFIMPSSVEIIEYGACSDTLLTSVTLSENLREIRSWAFTNSFELAEIKIGDKVELIETGAFGSTEFLKNPDNWEDGALYLGNCLIATNDDIASSYAIKDGTTCIAGMALAFNQTIQSVFIPDSVKYINSVAFGYSTLKNLTFENPNGWTANYPIRNLDYQQKEEKTRVFTAEELSDPANNVIIFMGDFRDGVFWGPSYNDYLWTRSDNI